MIFYYPKSLYDNSARWHIFPLLKSLMKEENNWAKNLSITENIDEADCVILPMSWNYYHTHNNIQEVLNYYKNLPNNRPIVSFVFGDFGVKVPKTFSGYVFRSNGGKSKQSSNHKGLPVFIEDPILKYFPNQDAIPKATSNKATVGFCGQAIKLGKNSIKEVLKTAVKNMLSSIGYTKRDTEQLISTTYFRWKILNNLQKSDKVISNFILRKAYRAGVASEKDRLSTSIEFYNNIKDSDYVICMRGAGNFSTRFYETLAMGRIPVFVNTDCLLPLESKINWKEHVVWVAYNERHLVAEKVYKFHKKHDNTSLNNLFLANRKLWEEQLQLYPFFNTFFNED
ncbi:exostosin domain-containing protein [Winogradskyella immobilis]|uniref:Exostosin family protein n=1 Tax=Winogradskyella immobilis TaxID=2816852 RepID=A0ABS8EP16_9FLAO|nr:exostosin family protein [Winogradskyella immobilis]MCC1484888.1 exostosin family protein [Winogradskyella immobilis]MCG0016980.1 glycosyltransferase family 47 protein [Winogradskyella immobilis]